MVLNLHGSASLSDRYQEEYPMPTSVQSHSAIESQVFKMYQELDIGRNSVCQECRRWGGPNMVDQPVALWHVGEDFEIDDRRIVFVGKTARDHVGEPHHNFLGRHRLG